MWKTTGWFEEAFLDETAFPVRQTPGWKGFLSEQGFPDEKGPMDEEVQKLDPVHAQCLTNTWCGCAARLVLGTLLELATWFISFDSYPDLFPSIDSEAFLVRNH